MGGTQASKLRGGGGRGNLRFSPSFFLPFLARSTQAIGPLWLLSFSLSNLVWQDGMEMDFVWWLKRYKTGDITCLNRFQCPKPAKPGNHCPNKYSGTPPYVHLVITASFFQPGKTSMHKFPHKKKALLQSPVNTANGHILKSQTVESLIILPRYYRHSFEIWKIKMPLTCQFYWTSNPRLFLYNCF